MTDSKTLRGGVALRALILLGAGVPVGLMTAAPAWAQDVPPAAAPPATAPPATADTQATAPEPDASTGVEERVEDEEIVVTGSILRRNGTETPSPITIRSAEELERRAVSTVQEGIQQLTSNNGPALTNSFTANGAFGAGASAVSLRGLSTSSTLVLFDGLRAAYYPLSDDGTRNFVDLNTIPDEIIDRIEVLRDGASSSYGADAIAGVVNIITKREFKGIGGRAEAGISERGDAANQRLSLIAGIGDIGDKGFNAYVSGFYLRSEAVFNRDRPSPYNSDDQRGISFNGQVGPNNIVDGLDENGVYNGFDILTTNTASTLYVRPYDGTNTTALGRYQRLNPGLGCQRGATYSLTAAELATDQNAAAPTTVCQEDLTNNFGVITPNIERFGGSARGTFTIGENSEAYALFNFQQSTVDFTGGQSIIRANAPTGINFPRFSTQQSGAAFAAGSGPLTLPVFVCAAGVSCDTAADRRLNPNNPFAAQGQVAQLIGRLPDIQTYNQTRSRVYRVAAGLSGTVLDDVDYQLDLTAMHNDLRRTSEGYVRIDRLLSAIGTGGYNFINPSLNSQDARDQIAPDSITDSSSDLYQAQFTVSKSLVELPGGPLQLGVGAAIRYEAVDAPSANDDANGPTQRYFTLNAFGTSGSRKVYSGYAELNAPIVEQFEINASGRYDKYSSGQDAFSPKIGAKFTPIPQIGIRGTYSRGFRIPSFAEANALPTTGFVTVPLNTLPQSFLSQYGANCSVANATGCSGYVTNYARGLTTLASPDLDPEKSRSFTGGIILNPIRTVTLTADYYNIRKTGAITTPSTAGAIAAYFAGQPIPAGFNVIADTPDPNFPNALPRIAFVESNLVNANTIKTSGIDFGATARFRINQNVTFTSTAEASYIIELSTTDDQGITENYEGTLGNFNLTAGSGTPQWRASWQNTIDVRGVSLTASANYFDGYDLSAEDQTGPGTAGQGGLNPGYVPNKVSDYVTLDLVGSVRVAERFTFYVNVLNVLDDLPPIDPVTYGAYLYNPVQGGQGILGRSFRAGVRVGF